MEEPVISFCVFIYNSEAYVRRAVESALSQISEPIEIIISDDNSSDRSFTIAKEIVENYHGVHRVILNKNNVNLGIREHFNKITSLCRGDYMVCLAGDDIALPTRVAKTAKVIKKFHPALITSNVRAINAADEEIEYRFNIDKGNAHFLNSAGFVDEELNCRIIRNFPLEYINVGWPGAPFTIKKDILKILNYRLPETVPFEDNFLSFLAYLNGDFVYLYEPQILYRVHSNNYTSSLTDKNNLNKSSLKWVTEFDLITKAKFDFFTKYCHLYKIDKQKVFSVLSVELLKNELKMAALMSRSSLVLKLKSIKKLLSIKSQVREKVKILFMIFFTSYVKAHEEKNTLKRSL